MPNNLTDAGEALVLDAALVNTDKVALMQVVGTDAAAGTEVAGGSYARQTSSWAAASTTGGNTTKATSADLTFSSMPATEVQGWAVYTSGGTRKWYGLWSPQTGTAQAAGDTVTIAGHGLTNGQKIVFQSGYAPAGLNANTTYFVVGATTNTFQVAATSGGAALDITADTATVVVGKVVETAVGETLLIAAGSIVCSLS